ncbi:MAG: hypothetical protein JXA43_02850, partial [Candidatus Diapherotrites archaeon]|nr:hypothetical protein [Candidatus Diapherotrites archaeon]
KTKKKEEKQEESAESSKEAKEQAKVFKFTKNHLVIAAVGIAGLIFVLFYIGFFSMLFGNGNIKIPGITPGDGDGNGTIIANPETPTLMLFYDPRTGGLSELESDLSEMQIFFSDLTIEKKCVDYDILMNGTPSSASTTCTTVHGENGFKDVLAEAQARNITENALFQTAGIYFMTSDKGNAAELSYSPFTNSLKARICENLDDALINCQNLEEIEPADVKIVYHSDCDNCAPVPPNLMDLEELGFKYRITNIYDLAEEGGSAETLQSAYSQRYAPFALIDANTLESFEPRIYNVLPYVSFKADAYYIVPSSSLSGKYIGPKYDSIRLDLYIMSYCPYGTLMEDVVAPVKKLLGDKLDVHPYFITYKEYSNPDENCESFTSNDGKDYQMCTLHGKKELEENRRQTCIYQKYGDAKWLEYTTCFNSGKSKDSCMSELGINKTEISSCITSNDTNLKMYEQLNIALENQVSGSPTTFINNEKYLGARDSNTLKATVCERLLNPPEGCNQIIESTTSGATGSC